MINNILAHIPIFNNPFKYQPSHTLFKLLNEPKVNPTFFDEETAVIYVGIGSLTFDGFEIGEGAFPTFTTPVKTTEIKLVRGVGLGFVLINKKRSR